MKYSRYVTYKFKYSTVSLRRLIINFVKNNNRGHNVHIVYILLTIICIVSIVWYSMLYLYTCYLGITLWWITSLHVHTKISSSLRYSTSGEIVKRPVRISRIPSGDSTSGLLTKLESDLDQKIKIKKKKEKRKKKKEKKEKVQNQKNQKNP